MRFLFFIVLGFLAGTFSQALLADARADTLYLCLAFFMGFIVCLVAVILFGTTTSKPVKQEKDPEKWWLRGEEPPWDTYQDEN